LATLYEPDEDESDLLTDDDQINSFAVLREQDKAAIVPPSPRYTAPSAGPFPFAIMGTVPMGTTVRHSDSLESELKQVLEIISAQHNIFI